MPRVQDKHQRYLEKLELPTSEQIAAIAKVQEEREEEILKRYSIVEDDGGVGAKREHEAAKTIQVRIV